jgi:2-methylcitrate dehydratase PrpD
MTPRSLLKHYRAMGGGLVPPYGKATAFVSGFKTNPVDAAFLNGHMIRAMDYNDIYWKADPCHPSDLIAAPLALCESEGLSGKDLILATIIAYEIEMRLCEIGRPGVREYGWHHATLSAFAAPSRPGACSISRAIKWCRRSASARREHFVRAR